MNLSAQIVRKTKSPGTTAVAKRAPARLLSAENKNLLLRTISTSVFWDMDISKLNVKNDKNIIIERVYTWGTENDEAILFKIYSFREIKNTIVKLDELNKRTLAYLSGIFKIKEKKFKCYGKKPYHLNYLEE